MAKQDTTAMGENISNNPKKRLKERHFHNVFLRFKALQINVKDPGSWRIISSESLS